MHWDLLRLRYDRPLLLLHRLHCLHLLHRRHLLHLLHRLVAMMDLQVHTLWYLIGSYSS
jgi:hypothetical protein